MIITTSTKNLPCGEIKFQSPKPGEGQALLEYFQRLFHESSENLNYPCDYYDNREAKEQEIFIKKFNEEAYSFAVFAYDKGLPIGHMVVKNLEQSSPYRGNLTMGVLENYKAMGVGRSLLQIAIDESEKLKMLHLELRVKVFNTPAIRLYEKNKFIRKEKINNEYVYVRMSNLS